MEIKAIYDKLLEHFGPDIVLGLTEAVGGIRDPFVTVAGRPVDKVCFFCRNEPALRFDFCQSISAMDEGETLVCVYHLYSYERRQTLVIKAATSRAEAQLPSVAAVWPAANWYEREAFDLFGITFTGHPDLRRLLLPEDWDGHPMRKDWREKARYNSMPTTRDNPLELLADGEPAA